MKAIKVSFILASVFVVLSTIACGGGEGGSDNNSSYCPTTGIMAGSKSNICGDYALEMNDYAKLFTNQSSSNTGYWGNNTNTNYSNPSQNEIMVFVRANYNNSYNYMNYNQGSNYGNLANLIIADNMNITQSSVVGQNGQSIFGALYYDKRNRNAIINILKQYSLYDTRNPVYYTRADEVLKWNVTYAEVSVSSQTNLDSLIVNKSRASKVYVRSDIQSYSNCGSNNSWGMNNTANTRTVGVYGFSDHINNFVNNFNRSNNGSVAQLCNQSY